jgi:hypothetical protein
MELNTSKIFGKKVLILHFGFLPREKKKPKSPHPPHKKFGILDETKHTHENFSILHFAFHHSEVVDILHFSFHRELNTA